MNQGPFKTGGFTVGDLPAFPMLVDNSNFDQPQQIGPHKIEPGEIAQFCGMTLRQYAAIHSPVSMIDANESLHQTAQFGKPSDRDAFPIRQVIAESVRLSVMYADLLMAELAKGQDAPAQTQSLSDKDNA
jgi:hypothetical protein